MFIYDFICFFYLELVIAKRFSKGFTKKMLIFIEKSKIQLSHIFEVHLGPFCFVKFKSEMKPKLYFFNVFTKCHTYFPIVFYTNPYKYIHL